MQNKNWITEFQESFRNSKDLASYLNFLPDSQKVEEVYPLFLPRRIAEKIKMAGPQSALARQFLPHENELSNAGLFDPIGDQVHFKAPQLIHRYHSRALFTPTNVCPVHCRYCFRKNEISTTDEIFHGDFEKTLSYLKSHPEISEIIFTGGDPLTLGNDKIGKYLEAFSKITHLKDIRFHTRYPVILPSRIEPGLINVLNELRPHFRTISIAIHINHFDEIDDQFKEAISLLNQNFFQLLSQTVLLKGVNDSGQDLLKLFDALIGLKVRPYYLHHPDQVKGGMHFYLPIEAGRKIYSEIRQKLPGWAIPHYVLDIPGGHGKSPATGVGELFLSAEGELLQHQEPDFFRPLH